MSEEVFAEVRDRFDRASYGWEKWADVLAQRDPGRYLRAVGVGTGERVLEIGAGTGDQTLAVAERVGTQGSVVAVDLSAEMLAVAERRAQAAGLNNIDFYVGKVSDAGLDDGGFDAAVSGFTWLFLPDPVGDASRVRSLLKPGGRFAASVWGPPQQVPMMALPMTVVIPELGIEPPTPQDDTMPLSDPAVFQQVLIDAGFDSVSVEAFHEDFTWKSGEQFADWVKDVVLTIGDLITEHAPDRQEEIYEKVAAVANTQTVDDGTLTLANLALLATGQRPS